MKNLTIKAKMLAVFALFFFLLAIVAAVGLRGVGQLNNDLAELYRERLVPVTQLARINDLMHVNIEQLTIAVISRSSSANIQKYVKRVEANLAEIDSLYKNYAKLITTEEQKKQLAEWTSLRDGLIGKGIKPAMSALMAQKFNDAEDILLGFAIRRFAKVQDLFETIIASERKAAEQTKIAAEGRYNIARFLMFGAGLFAFGLTIVMALYVRRGITGPLATLTGVLGELTKDRIVEVPFTARGDEIGGIAKATEIFKQSIAGNVINLRVRSALDVVNSNVMVADDDYNIMYMNTTMQDMLREAEPELRKVLPAFDSGKLIGTNMDVFHNDPAHQRKLMDALTDRRESHITVGSQKFHHVAIPVVDQHGKRVGTVVEWKNVTVEKAIETEVADIVQAAVAGDFAKRVPVEGKQGFMLNLANAMNSLCDNTGKALDELAGMMGALAEGDMTQRITADYQGMFGRLKDDANTMADRIGATITEIKASAREVANASAEISTSTTDLSQRTEEQAASLEETSASMEEISSTVKKNAENAQAANQSAASTREVATRGGEVVGQAVNAMARIEESSGKVADIIGVIDEIARQTNLLALNAAVEAARAGEAGRGFAVVASEVRSLAQRSSQAAKDIKDLITNSSGQVKEGVELVNKAGASLEEIVDSIKKVAAIVSDIAAASAEQSSGIDQVNKALAQMDEVTQQNSALVEENAATAKTLEHQAVAMNERVAFFRLAESGAAQGAARPVEVEGPAKRGAAKVKDLAPLPAA